MEYRLNRSAIIWSTLLVCIAGAVFAYTYFSQKPEAQEMSGEPSTDEERVGVPEVINAKHHIEGELHTIAGSVVVPSACHSVSVEPFMKDESGSEVELKFSLVLGEGECAQNATDATFKVTFNAKPDARITATWQDMPIKLNLLPAESRESLDREFYFKG